VYRRILIAPGPEGLSGDAASAVSAVAAPGAGVLVTWVRDPSQPESCRSAGERALQQLLDELVARDLRVLPDRRDTPSRGVAQEIATRRILVGIGAGPASREAVAAAAALASQETEVIVVHVETPV
jgi:hypothetical protein